MIRLANFLPQRLRWSIALSVILTAAVIVLATLQYQWIGRLTEVERDRLQARLAASVDLFRDAFNRELIQIVGAFRRDLFLQATEDLTLYVQMYEDWREGTRHPELVKALFVATLDRESRFALLRYEEIEREFRPLAASEDSVRLVQACALSTQGAAGTREEMFRRIFRWRLAFIDRRPFLVGPIYRFRPPPRPPVGRPPVPARYLFLELNDDFIARQFLPELSRRVFGESSDSNYQLAVFLSHEPGDAIYSSDLRPIDAAGQQYDVKVNLLWGPDWQQRGSGAPLLGANPNSFGLPSRSLWMTCDPKVQWVLAARHRAGSVELAAGSLRTRNLAVSGAVLILLIFSIVMIIVSSQKTRRLARLELEFAAGMSHEVRTPLAVIGSASDNLAEGVVAAPEQVKEYGALIRREARRLSGMVEQTLQFSATQSGSLRYELSAVDAREVVRGVLAELAPTLAEAGFQVAEHVEEGVPFVLANPSALSRCVQNLVTNAMKHGAEGRWVAVRIEKTPHENHTVSISVADRGPGILAEDLSHIFDAFYQGSSAKGLKSQGVGLGLALTKDMVKAMGGSITVDAKPGRGATFTLHLQAAGNESKNTPC